MEWNLLDKSREVSMSLRGGGSPKRSMAGFSLIEMLVVVFIVGIIAAISTLSVSTTLKKARLETMAETVRGLIGRAKSYAVNNQANVFVILGPTGNAYGSTAGPKGIILLVDRNRNNVPDDAIINTTTDYVCSIGQGALTQLVPGIPIRDRGNDDISLSIADVTKIQANWPIFAGAAGGPATPYDQNFAILVVDPVGRTLDPNTFTMVANTMTLTVTHRDMVTGSLRPQQIRTVRISPLFGVSVVKNTESFQ
jgi:prepilin-type N-terminal cleavage/methylation domain-containing protein